MLKAAKERNKPQPNGGAGKKQGSAYGGSKQKDAPASKNEEVEQIDELSKETLGSYKHKAELSIPKDDRAYTNRSKGIDKAEKKMKSEELHGDQHKLDKNKNGKVDGIDLAHLCDKKKTQDVKLAEEVKVGDKVSFDHPMTAAPGKTTKKVGTVKRIVDDTAHLKSSTKYGTLSYEKKVSELRKEEFDLEEAAKGHTIEAHGVKGMKSTPWRKTFKHEDHLNDWADKNDAKVRGTRDVEKSKIKEELEEGKYSDDDWVIMKSDGTMDNPKKDTIVGYRKAGKGAYSAPKTEPGKKAMRISVAKQKGYAISVTEETAELAEAPNYKLYHTTSSAAVQEAMAVAKKQGYEVDEEAWPNKVATGPKKPIKDKTNSYSIDMTKNESSTKKKLQIQVYNMGEKYELNTYVQ
jgi:hypothetical protein